MVEGGQLQEAQAISVLHEQDAGAAASYTAEKQDLGTLSKLALETGPLGTSQELQRLGLPTSTSGAIGLNPGQGIKILWCSQKERNTTKTCPLGLVTWS